MKKMSIFGLVALLVLSFASMAQALDLKASGKWQIEAQWNNDLDFANISNQQTNSFHIEQRVRTAFTFIANENLKGVLDTQIGAASWGNGAMMVSAGRSPVAAATGSTGAGNGNIMLRQGYIDFKWPGTKVNFKVGFQSLSLPAAFGGGSAVLDDQVAAAVVSAPITDNISVLGAYVRAFDANGYGTTAAIQGGTSTDAVALAVPISLPGYSIAPWAMYAYSGKNANITAGTGLTNGLISSGWNGNDPLKAYWGGIAFTMTAFEPIKVMADFNYGRALYYNGGLAAGDKNNGGRAGWLFDLAVDYTGLSMMTPEVFFVYTSGETGRNTNKSGRMPVVGNPQTWSPNNSIYFGDRNFISGFSTNVTGGGQGGYVRNNMGFWTLGLALKDIKLIDKLSHTVNLMYVKGTNDSDYLKGTRAFVNYGAFLTDRDHLWEVDLNNKYKVYDELTLFLDLGYANVSMDKSTWASVSTQYNQDKNRTNNLYRIALGAAYAF